jgi:hypothetical protein
MTVDLAFLTIAEASALLQARQLSPVEYVEALITRAETFEPQLHAYITPTFDLARQQAKQAEHEIMAGTYRGPMHGIPFALTASGQPAGDAFAIRRYRCHPYPRHERPVWQCQFRVYELVASDSPPALVNDFAYP